MTRYEQTIDAIVKDRSVLSQRCVEATDPSKTLMIIKDLRKTASILDRNPKLRCLGLSANQIGYNARIFVLKNQRGKFEPFVNPEILRGMGSKPSTEGCFSFPGVRRTVDRFMSIMVIDESNKVQKFTGIMAIAFQHELNHLDGEII